MKVVKKDGRREDIDLGKIRRAAKHACQGLSNVIADDVVMSSQLKFFDGIKTSDIQSALILSAAQKIAEEGNYSYVAARLQLQDTFKQVTDGKLVYPSMLKTVKTGINENRFDKRLTQFDFSDLDAAIVPERDLLLDFLSMSTLTDRYLMRREPRAGQDKGTIFELPQHFWMRVAMGLALGLEGVEERTEAAIRYYNRLSIREFVSSTPTLFNSGTRFSQMSSCYGNFIEDNLVEAGGIFPKMTECAALSKYAGGIGTCFTRIRAKGGHISATNGQSSGIVPWLKIYNDTSVGVNQGGKRKGAFAAYLEPWHADVLDFIDLKKKTGDERRRTHDIFPVLFMNDLFMRRKDDPSAKWSLFDPHTVPALVDTFGTEFEKVYLEAEKAGLAKAEVNAAELWQRIVLSAMATGAPWITFKDEHNRRNPQQHAGMIHNSNLCTEISLNNSGSETFVCNLGSVNLAELVKDGKMDFELLGHVVSDAVEMLDNVIDLNFYPSEDSRRSNLKHRPIGLGVMGYAEALVKCGIDYESEAHLEWADKVFEVIAYHSIVASSILGRKRGNYESFEGSLWSQGILTHDTARSHGHSHFSAAAWDRVRQLAKQNMRNCNLIAIAPTATIANIAGTTQCTEASAYRIYKKENIGGLYRVVEPCQKHNRPDVTKMAYEIDPIWLIRSAAVRQKWVDQAQSLNIFCPAHYTGRDIAAIYDLAWREGLKSTYYLMKPKNNAGMKKVGE